MFSITYREATRRETCLLTQQARVDVQGWSQVLVGYAMGFAVLCGGIGLGLDWWTSRLNLAWAPWCTVSGSALGAVLGFTFLVSWHRIETRHRLGAKTDLRRGRSQVVQVDEAETVCFRVPGHESLAVACQVDEQHVLLIWGPCLEDPGTYEIDQLVAERDELSLSGYGGAFAFPSSRFAVTRGSVTGTVVAIELQGSARPLRYSCFQPTGRFDFDECCVFRGSIAKLGETLQRDRLVDPDSLMLPGEDPGHSTSPALRAVGAEESGPRGAVDQLPAESGGNPSIREEDVDIDLPDSGSRPSV